MKRTLKTILAVVAVVIVAIAGLSALHVRNRATAAQKDDWIVQQWCRTIRGYNINPVYPPSEDMHVGDILGFGDNFISQSGSSGTAPLAPANGSSNPQISRSPASSDESTASADRDCLLFNSVKVGYEPMTDILKRYYDAMPVFPDTGPPPKDSSDLWRQSQSGTHCDKDSCKVDPSANKNIFLNVGNPDRLPIVAFPAFTANRALTSGVSASWWTSLTNWAFGDSAATSDAVSIRIRAAETYGVPAGVALAVLETHCDPGDGKQPDSFDCRHDTVAGSIQSLRGARPGVTAVSLVYRIYLVRSIEYTFNANSELGAQAIATLKRTGTNDNKEAGPPDDAEAASGATAQEKATQLANRAIAKAAPGASIHVGAVSDNGVTFIETFERPVAIGYRSVSVPTSGEPQ